MRRVENTKSAEVSLSRSSADKHNPNAKLYADIINWDPALRNGNRWYDRLVVAMRVKNRDDREKQFAQLERDLKTVTDNAHGIWAIAKIALSKDRASATGEAFGNVLVGLLVPSVGKIRTAADRVEQAHANVQLAFALSCYRAEHADYPLQLDVLAPAYLVTIPKDVFSGKAIIYRRSDNGYLLYSVGPNGRDEQGRSRDDDPAGNDLSVRMPLLKLPRAR